MAWVECGVVLRWREIRARERERRVREFEGVRGDSRERDIFLLERESLVCSNGGLEKKLGKKEEKKNSISPPPPRL